MLNKSAKNILPKIKAKTMVLLGKYGRFSQSTLLFIISIFLTKAIFAQKKFVESDVFGTKYWIENKGQFPFSSINTEDILYVFDNRATTYVLSKGGLFVLQQIHHTHENLEKGKLGKIESWIDREKEEEKQELENKNHRPITIDSCWLKMEFKGYNPNFTKREESPSPHYFTCGVKEMRATGYKKIIFENYYPNIDLEWIIAESNPQYSASIAEGIEYRFVVHKGGNINAIQWNYQCINDPTLSWKVGNLNTAFIQRGDSLLFKHKDFTWKEFGLKLLLPEHIASSHYQIRYQAMGDKMGLKLVERIQESEGMFSEKAIHTLPFDFVIDPFVSFQGNSFYLPKLIKQHITACDYDAEGNCFFYGEALGFVHKLAKYSADGKLIWSFIGAPPMQYIKFNPGPFGNIRVDRYSGKVYMLPGSGPPSFARVTADGDYDHYWAKPENSIEFYDIQFYPTKKSMVFYLGKVKYNTLIYNVKDSWPVAISRNVLTDSSIAKDKEGGRDYINAVTDDYSRSFAIISQSFSSDTTHYECNNRVVAINDSFTATVWKKHWGFTTFFEYDNNVIEPYRYNTNPYSSWYKTNHFKALGVYDQYLYVFDGKHIVAFNKKNGAKLGIDSIPVDRSIQNSGIAVDSCNHIYLGGDSSRVFVLQFNGSKFSHVKTLQIFKNKPNRVYDVHYNYDEHILYVSGDSFAASIPCEVPCGNKIRLKTSSLRSCGEPLWAKITNPDSLLTYTFEWRDGQTHQKLQTTTLKGKHSDTFYKPQIGHVYKLFIFINQFGTGTFKTVTYTVKKSFDSTCHYRICEGDTLLINGKKIGKSADFIDTLKTYFGCDSIITYHIQKYQHSKSYQYIHRCYNDSFAFNNQTIKTSGIYYDTLVNYEGCDSIIKLELFFQTDSTHSFDTICNRDTLTFYQQKIDKSGIYFHENSDSNGCKYIEKETVTVLLDSGFQIIKLCDGDTFLSPRNKNYFKAGNYKDTLLSSKGCDSILHTKIQLLSPSFKAQKLPICKGDTLKIANHRYDKPGIYLDTFVNAVGCDSVLQSDIYFYPNRDSTVYLTLCNQDSAQFKGKNYLLPAKIKEQNKDLNGCDSIFYLNISNSKVTANFTLDSTNKPSFIFINQSVNDTLSRWKVDENYEPQATVEPFVFEFEPAGQMHKVCLEVTNKDNCKDTFCLDIFASKIAYKLYNTFTPNGDGLNDLLFIDNIGGNFKYDVFIHNRWGEVMYQSVGAMVTDPSKLWNGRVNNVGPECPSGTYFALFNFYIGKDGSKPIFTEIPITLIRTP